MENKEINYINYRAHIESMSFKKEQLINKDNERKKTDREIKVLKLKRNQLYSEVEKLRNELIEMIPKRF